MFAFIFSILLLLNSFICVAGQEQALIAAVVNQRAITERELEMRLDFAIATLNMANTKESRDSMRHQVLQNLVIEKLQESSASEAGIKITEKEIDESVANIARENNMTLDQLQDSFKRKGVKIDTLRNRMKAQLLWTRFIRALFGGHVRLSDSDIKRELDRVIRVIETDQYELIEIVLPIDDKNRAKSKQDADRLHMQVSQPMTNFRLVAQQFGAQSGYVGWKTTRQMDEEVAKIVQNTNVGEVTRPIETQNTYKIIKLIDKKLAGQGSFRSKKMSVAKVAIQLPEDMNDENMMILETIVTHLKRAKTCGEFQQIGNDANGQTAIVEKQPMSSFPEPLQIILDKVAVNQVAGPIQEDKAVGLYMVCSVERPERDPVPTHKEIKENLEQRELSRQASRLLNKLLSTARIVMISEESRGKNKQIKKAVSVESGPIP